MTVCAAVHSRHFEGEHVQVSVGNSVYAGTICALSSGGQRPQCKIRWQWSGFKPSWVESSDIVDPHSMGTDQRGRRTSKRDRSITPLPAYERTVAAEQQRRLEQATASVRSEISSHTLRHGGNKFDCSSRKSKSVSSGVPSVPLWVEERQLMYREDFDVLLRPAERAADSVPVNSRSCVHQPRVPKVAGVKRMRSTPTVQSAKKQRFSPSLLAIPVGVDPPAESMSRWLLTVASATSVPSLRSKLIQKLCMDAALRLMQQAAPHPSCVLPPGRSSRGTAPATPGGSTASSKAAAVPACQAAEAYRCAWAAESLPFVFRQVGFLALMQLHCDGLLCGVDVGPSAPTTGAPPGSVASVRLPALLSVWNSCLLWQAVPPSVWLQGWLPLVHAMVLLQWMACASKEEQDAVMQRTVLLPIASSTPDGGRLPGVIRSIIGQSMQTLQEQLCRLRASCTSPAGQAMEVKLPCSPAAAVWATPSAHTSSKASSSSPQCSSPAAAECSTGSSWVCDLHSAAPPRRAQHTAARTLAHALFDARTAAQISPGHRASGLEAFAQRLAVAAHAQCVLAAGRLLGLSRAALCVQGGSSSISSLLQQVPCDESASRSAFDQLISSERTASCLLLWHRCVRQDKTQVTAALCKSVLQDSAEWSPALAACEQTLPGAPPAYHQFKSGLPDSPIRVKRHGLEWQMPPSSTVLDSVEASIGQARVSSE